VRVTICQPAELGTAEIARWRELQRAEARQAHPFLTPDFALALGRHRRDVRVAVLEDSLGIAGFFPYQQGRFGIGRALGYGLSNLQGLVLDGRLEWDAPTLLARCGLAVFEFDEFLAEQCERFRPRQVVAEPAPFIDLSAGFEAWLASKLKSGRAVRASQRKLRKLAREVGEVSFDYDSTAPETLDLLMRWKSQQYRRTGRFDRFARPWFRAAFTELAQTSTADFSGVRSVLFVGGRPVSIRQGLCAGGILSDWFPSYDVNLASYSPGQSAVLEWLRAAAERGVRRIDLGKGYSLEKEVFQDGHHDVASGWVEGTSPVAVLRRLQQAPRRRALDVVLNRPGLRRAARETLNEIGRVRSALSRG
jgi:CelD/BcsL family acetyltransferase involved in cellulose biosynthesis